MFTVNSGFSFCSVAHPALKYLVHRRRADERLIRQRQLAGVKQEGLRLGTTHPTVEADLLLKGGSLVLLGVVEAAHLEVGRIFEAIVALQMQRSVGTKASQGVLPLHPILSEIVPALTPDDDRSMCR